MFDKNFEGLDIISDIVKSVDGKSGKIVSFNNDHWRVEYGSRPQDHIKLSNVDVYNQLNEQIMPERGMEGTLKMGQRGYVLIVEQKEKLNENERPKYKMLAKVHLNLHSKSLNDGKPDVKKVVFSTGGDTKNEMIKKAHEFYGKTGKYWKIEHTKIEPINEELGEDGHFRKKLNKIDEEQLDEISKEKLGSYIKSASQDVLNKSRDNESFDDKVDNRQIYINKAADKFNKKIAPYIKKNIDSAINKTRNWQDGREDNDEHVDKHIIKINKHVDKKLNENALKNQYEKNLEKMSDEQLKEECQNAARISIASKGRDTFKSNACLEECRRRNKTKIYMEAVADVSSD